MKFALKNKVSFFCKVIVIKVKIKGVVEDLKEKRMIVKIVNISRTFSGVVVGSVGSVHFWIVPWSGLYFSRSIGPFLCSQY